MLRASLQRIRNFPSTPHPEKEEEIAHNIHNQAVLVVQFQFNAVSFFLFFSHSAAAPTVVIIIELPNTKRECAQHDAYTNCAKLYFFFNFFFRKEERKMLTQRQEVKENKYYNRIGCLWTVEIENICTREKNEKNKCKRTYSSPQRTHLANMAD